MLSGVSTICFAASYAIALVLEISRLWFRSSVRGVVLFGFAGAGLVAHTAFLYYRAIQTVGSPLSSERDWFLIAAWTLVVAYLCLAAAYPKFPFGLFLLPLALLLIAAARFLANPQSPVNEPASKAWGAIHGLSIMLAAVAVLIGFAAGLMYVVQMRQLKHKRLPGRGLRLPSLEWLERANSRAIMVSVILLAAGVVSGIILNRIDVEKNVARLPWYDPVILSTLLLLVWLLVATVVSTVYRSARKGRKVAYLTLVSFLFLAIVLAVGLLLSSRHWERGRAEGGKRTAESRASLAGRAAPVIVSACPRSCPLSGHQPKASRERARVRAVGCRGTISSPLPAAKDLVPTSRFFASLRMTASGFGPCPARPAACVSRACSAVNASRSRRAIEVP